MKRERVDEVAGKVQETSSRVSKRQTEADVVRREKVVSSIVAQNVNYQPRWLDTVTKI